MSNQGYTHVAFADESSWNKGRFRSIALVTAAVEDARSFHSELEALRKSQGKSEFKWKDTRRAHGIALVDFFFARHDRLRVDVLTWDINDSRHSGLSGRDDRANFVRMYYHLLHTTLKRRWPNESRWLICPDEHKEVEWNTLEYYLTWKSWAVEENLFTIADMLDSMQEFYHIIEIRPVSSKDFPLIQLADLFAGLATYSRSSHSKYQYWRSQSSPSLFDDPSVELSNSDKERLPIVQHVWSEARRRKFQVSLESKQGLHSNSPDRPLNFWLYEPQRPQDKAPVRKK